MKRQVPLNLTHTVVFLGLLSSVGFGANRHSDGFSPRAPNPRVRHEQSTKFTACTESLETQIPTKADAAESFVAALVRALDRRVIDIAHIETWWKIVENKKRVTNPFRDIESDIRFTEFIDALIHLNSVTISALRPKVKTLIENVRSRTQIENHARQDTRQILAPHVAQVVPFPSSSPGHVGFYLDGHGNPMAATIDVATSEFVTMDLTTRKITTRPLGFQVSRTYDTFRDHQQRLLFPVLKRPPEYGSYEIYHLHFIDPLAPHEQLIAEFPSRSHTTGDVFVSTKDGSRFFRVDGHSHPGSRWFFKLGAPNKRYLPLPNLGEYGSRGGGFGSISLEDGHWAEWVYESRSRKVTVLSTRPQAKKLEFLLPFNQYAAPLECLYDGESRTYFAIQSLDSRKKGVFRLDPKQDLNAKLEPYLIFEDLNSQAFTLDGKMGMAVLEKSGEVYFQSFSEPVRTTKIAQVPSGFSRIQGPIEIEGTRYLKLFRRLLNGSADILVVPINGQGEPIQFSEGSPEDHYYSYERRSGILTDGRHIIVKNEFPSGSHGATVIDADAKPMASYIVPDIPAKILKLPSDVNDGFSNFNDTIVAAGKGSIYFIKMFRDGAP
jgi:hypothetical protein